MQLTRLKATLRHRAHLQHPHLLATAVSHPFPARPGLRHFPDQPLVNPVLGFEEYVFQYSFFQANETKPRPSLQHDGA